MAHAIYITELLSGILISRAHAELSSEPPVRLAGDMLFELLVLIETCWSVEIPKKNIDVTHATRYHAFEIIFIWMLSLIQHQLSGISCS